ncbi:phosphoribosylformylglycinamidine [Candidatus Brocadia sinica JPN1]|uniref:Phosphoribosylformylglycinamidine n=1 Tax=Candidatus Brocadia sinica JPN1 TaxID=1197129 RepID=A0ABQ0JYA6_9BACT|nr:phosphoribosylformylglycinamidine [Candidatus Brocadia sinica JPN1]
MNIFVTYHPLVRKFPLKRCRDVSVGGLTEISEIFSWFQGATKAA